MNVKLNVVANLQMELHFIDMKAFAKAVNDEDNGINIKETSEDMFVDCDY